MADKAEELAREIVGAAFNELDRNRDGDYEECAIARVAALLRPHLERERWRSCTFEMPEPNAYVFFWVDAKRNWETGYFRTDRHYSWETERTDGYDDPFIFYVDECSWWMPAKLPAPPEEEMTR